MRHKIKFNHCGSQFVVKNVTRAVRFYRNVLGFKTDYLSGSPPSYAVVFRDDVYIHLCHQETQSFSLGTGCAFIEISGVDALWEIVQNTDAEILDPLDNQDYGIGVHFRLFTVKDIDQNVLRIGEPIKPKEGS